ncbi:MAG: hypothetical protein M3Q45_06240, partial [Chloroflexota bacterium]|nr:hypothetical protein [Chloroflexota bacterium]
IKTSGVKLLSGVITALPHPLSLLAKTSGKDTITLGANTFQDKTEAVKLKYDDRVTHVNLIGRSRDGKSNLIHHMIHQDIQNGKGVGLIDPHGSLVNAVLASSIPADRVQDVILLDVSDKDFPFGLNLLSPERGVPIETHAAFVVAVLRKVFGEIWSAGRMEDVIYASVISLLAYPGSTIQDIPRLLLNPQFRAMVVKKVRDPVARDFWRDEFEPRTDAVKLQIAQPVNSRLRRLFRDPDLRRILCQRGSLDFREMLDQNTIFLANLGGMAEVEAETIGALLMAKIQMAAMSRGQQPEPVFYFYIDEVQNFVTTSLAKILSEAQIRVEYGDCQPVSETTGRGYPGCCVRQRGHLDYFPSG